MHSYGVKLVCIDERNSSPSVTSETFAISSFAVSIQKLAHRSVDFRQWDIGSIDRAAQSADSKTISVRYAAYSPEATLGRGGYQGSTCDEN